MCILHVLYTTIISVLPPCGFLIVVPVFSSDWTIWWMAVADDVTGVVGHNTCYYSGLTQPVSATVMFLLMLA